MIADLSGELVCDDGVFRIRYAKNPTNDRFVIISEYTDDEVMTPWVIGNIERRLIIITGFPSL